MKKPVLSTVLFLLPFLFVSAQFQMGKKAILNPDGTLSVEPVMLPETSDAQKSNSVNLLFSFARPANQYFKNVRGTTLADVDGDGVQEILYGIDDTLYAIEENGNILWTKSVSGFITYPPTVYDLNEDGTPEIILNTRAISGATTGGRVYLMDNLGNDLSGWPLNFSDHGMLNAPVVADLNDDGALDIITTERVDSSVGYVHALNFDGTPLNSNWPVQLPGTPAFTPSVGDVDNDGDSDLVISTVDALYIFDNQGTVFSGFPVANAGVKFSYQSPILADLDNNGDLEIICSNHGDNPGYFVMEHTGVYKTGWPVPVNNWVYSPPTVADVDDDGTYELFFGDRKTNSDGTTPSDVIYGFTPDGNNLPNFPISKYGGNESVLGLADINNDDVLEIIFTSIVTDADGYGYVHAYSLDGSGEIAGFPLRPRGFTFLNAALVGDVNNDGMMDLTTNSYTMTFGASVDSTFVNVYNLNVPYDPSKILRNGYKGNNTRNGLVDDANLGVADIASENAVRITPNPSNGMLKIEQLPKMQNASIEIFNLSGKLVFSAEKNTFENQPLQFDLGYLQTGLYLVKISAGKNTFARKWIRK